MGENRAASACPTGAGSKQQGTRSGHALILDIETGRSGPRCQGDGVVKVIQQLRRSSSPPAERPGAWCGRLVHPIALRLTAECKRSVSPPATTGGATLSCPFPYLIHSAVTAFAQQLARYPRGLCGHLAQQKHPKTLRRVTQYSLR